MSHLIIPPGKKKDIPARASDRETGENEEGKEGTKIAKEYYAKVGALGVKGFMPPIFYCQRL